MAKRTASARKQARKSERRRLSNRQTRLALKNILKKAAAAKTGEEARKLLPEVQSLVDKSARRHVVHRKTAARIKSRVAREAAEAK